MPRLKVTYSGHVQGVGFRATTAYLARGFEVSGTVRNLPDGDVELVVEGQPDQIEGLLQAIDEALGSRIREAREQNDPSLEPLAGFSIVY